MGRWVFYAPINDAAFEFISSRLKPPRGAPPAEHKWEWVRRYYEMMAQQAEWHEQNDHDDDPPPSKLGVCGLIAEEDYTAHPERWNYDPRSNPRKAERRVWKLVGPLVKNDERVLRKARSTALYLGAAEARNRLNKR
jgi:hypothetical protein